MEGLNLPTHSPSNPEPVIREVECPECAQLARSATEEKVSTIDAFKAGIREKIGNLADRQFRVLKLAGAGVATGIASVLFSPSACPSVDEDYYTNCVAGIAAVGTAVALASLAALALYGLDAAAEKQEAENTLTEESLRLHALCLKGDPKYFKERIEGLENDYHGLSQAADSLKETTLIPLDLIEDFQECGVDNDSKAVLLHLAEELLQSAKEAKNAYDKHDLPAACALLKEKVATLETNLMSLYPDEELGRQPLPVSEAFQKLVHA